MTAAPAEGGTIFIFERETPWLSDTQEKTNWLRIWHVITGAEVYRQWLFSQMPEKRKKVNPSQPQWFSHFFQPLAVNMLTKPGKE